RDQRLPGPPPAHAPHHARGRPANIGKIFSRLGDRRADHYDPGMMEHTRDELGAILEGIDTAVVAVDRDWRFTYFNSAADALLRQLGRTGEGLFGKVFWLEFPELIGTSCDREFRRAFAEGVPVAFDTHYLP